MGLPPAIATGQGFRQPLSPRPLYSYGRDPASTTSRSKAMLRHVRPICYIHCSSPVNTRLHESCRYQTPQVDENTSHQSHTITNMTTDHPARCLLPKQEPIPIQQTTNTKANRARQTEPLTASSNQYLSTTHLSPFPHRHCQTNTVFCRVGSACI